MKKQCADGQREAVLRSLVAEQEHRDVHDQRGAGSPVTENPREAGAGCVFDASLLVGIDRRAASSPAPNATVGLRQSETTDRVSGGRTASPTGADGVLEQRVACGFHGDRP